MLIKHQRLVLVLICLLSLLTALWDFDWDINPQMELWGDNAEFIVLARSIVQGKWMQLINQPDSPRSDKFPFGFPLLLAGVEALAPGNMLAMKGLVLTLYVVAMPLLYLLLQRYLPPLPALAATLLSLLNPLLLPFSHQVMSEIPYLLASILTLLCFERSAETPGRRGTQWLMGGALLCVAATTLRIVGVSLFGGAVLWCLIRRQYRQGLWLMGVYLGVLLGLHLLGAGVFGSFYVGELFKANPAVPASGTVGLAQLPGRIVANLKGYFLIHIPEWLFPLPTALPPGAIKLVARLLTTSLVTLILIGLGREARKRALAPFYFLAYFGILMLWSYASWPPRRYLITIIPFLLLFFFSGLSVATRRIALWSGRTFTDAAPRGTGIVIGTTCLLLFLGLVRDYELKEYRRHYPPHWTSFFEAAEWLKKRSPPDSIILARKEHALYLSSNRRTVRVESSLSPEEVIDLIQKYRVNYVLLDVSNAGGVFRQSPVLMGPIHSHPEMFEPAYGSPTVPTTIVLKVKQQALGRENGSALTRGSPESPAGVGISPDED